MAFDPSLFKKSEPKKLPVLLLLDVSGSMYGEKIEALHLAVTNMVQACYDARVKEIEICISIITFGGNSAVLHLPYTPVKNLVETGIPKFEASGPTPMGTAIKLAKEIIENREMTPSIIYRPAVVLLSDGVPTDETSQPMHDFLHEGRSAKCQCFAVAIGSDADDSLLKSFCSDEANMLYADNASDIVDAFKTISMSVSKRASSKNPNAFASKAAADAAASDKAPAANNQQSSLGGFSDDDLNDEF